MAVYIDKLQEYTPEEGGLTPRFGPVWCHLWADTYEELRYFATQLGLRPHWYQDTHPNPAVRYYILVPSKRMLAVWMGAEERPTADLFGEEENEGNQDAEPVYTKPNPASGHHSEGKEAL